MTTENRTERMLERMQSVDLEEASSFIQDLTNQIAEPIRRVPENVFREVFLPVFAGLDPELEKRTQEFAAHWAGVVGSAMEPAEIVDVQGNKLFTVPALVDTSRLNQSSFVVGKDSFRSIFGNLIETAAIHPQMAVGEFTAAASKRLDTTIKQGQSSSNPWEEVFSYYGLVQKKEENTSSAAAPTTLDDDFEF
jgi:hypothetical protein